jgi:hypothetical protein
VSVIHGQSLPAEVGQIAADALWHTHDLSVTSLFYPSVPNSPRRTAARDLNSINHVQQCLQQLRSLETGSVFANKFAAN